VSAARNQVRVIDPEQDRRLRLVSETLARDGMPAALTDILAEGFVARLRRRVYAALDDVLGSGDDVEALAGWQGPPRSLVAALQRASYVREINGVFVMVDAVNEAPEYAKKRWQRQKPETYKRAVARCAKPNVANAKAGTVDDADDDWDFEAELQQEDDMQKEQPGLFGDAAVQPGEKHVGTPGFDEAKKCWHEAYLAVNKVSYPWNDRRWTRELVALLELAGDVHRLKRVFAVYLADRTPRYVGHQLGWLKHDFARFNVLAEQRGQHGGRGSGGSQAHTRSVLARVDELP
jgi:hypothetical protein